MLYADYGNSETVTKNRLAPLPAGCGDLPSQAHMFHLALLNPVPEDWADEARAYVHMGCCGFQCVVLLQWDVALLPVAVSGWHCGREGEKEKDSAR